MKFTAKQISDKVNGTIIGDPNETFSGFSKIEDTQTNTISFIGSSKYLEFLPETKANVIIISRELVHESKYNVTLIVVDDAHQAFVELIRMFYKMTRNELSGISEQAVIDKSASIGNNCYIGSTVVVFKNVSIGHNCQIYPQVFLGANVTVGDNTILMPGVKIYDNCAVGNNCLIHAGVVIGSDGFGFTQENGVNVKVPQMGNVIVGNDVEIGANCAIDRATLGSTIVNDGVKLDNLVHIAHNAEVGVNTVIACQTAVAGSTKIGHNCMIGGQVGMIDHLKIGNNVKIVAQSGLMHDIKDNEIIMGAPGFNFSLFKRCYVYFRNLPAIVKRLEKLEHAAENDK